MSLFLFPKNVDYLPMDGNIFLCVCHRVTTWTSTDDNFSGLEYHAHIDLHASSQTTMKWQFRIEVPAGRALFQGVLLP